MFATEKLWKSVHENEIVAAAFLDLSEALVSISHKVFLKELESLNFDEKAKTMKGTYLTEKHQKMTLSTRDSKRIQLYQGNRQGAILESLLFEIHVIDMQQTFPEKFSLIHYANDTLIISSHSDAKQAVQKLNTNVKNLVEFFQSHRPSNTDKLKIYFFANQTTTQSLITPDYRSKINTSMSRNL